jgi:hypothetical protein
MTLEEAMASKTVARYFAGRLVPIRLTGRYTESCDYTLERKDQNHKSYMVEFKDGLFSTEWIWLHALTEIKEFKK